MACIFVIREADTTAAIDDFSQRISLTHSQQKDRQCIAINKRAMGVYRTTE